MALRGHGMLQTIQSLIWVAGSLCAKLETDWSRRGAPWATEIYLPASFLIGVIGDHRMFSCYGEPSY